MPWLPNPGRVPAECVTRDEAGEVVSYRNVHVRLRQGYDSKKAGVAAWPAGGGRPPTRWAQRGDPFDITEYEVC